MVDAFDDGLGTTFLKRWSIEKLVPYARNPRTHSDQQIAQVTASIAKFGFRNPVVGDSQAGVIGGHGRLMAALYDRAEDWGALWEEGERTPLVKVNIGK